MGKNANLKKKKKEMKDFLNIRLGKFLVFRLLEGGFF